MVSSLHSISLTFALFGRRHPKFASDRFFVYIKHSTRFYYCMTLVIQTGNKHSMTCVQPSSSTWKKFTFFDNSSPLRFLSKTLRYINDLRLHVLRCFYICETFSGDYHTFRLESCSLLELHKLSRGWGYSTCFTISFRSSSAIAWYDLEVRQWPWEYLHPSKATTCQVICL